MAEMNTYRSTLTGPELDAALKSMGDLDAAIEEAKGYQQNAELNANQAQYWAQKSAESANGYLGYFSTPEDLQAAHPTGVPGNWATVGSTKSIWFWNGNAFVNTPGQASDTSFGIVKLSDSPNESLDASGGWAATPKAVAPLIGIGTTVSGQSTPTTVQNGGSSGTVGTLSIPERGIWIVFASGWNPSMGNDAIMYLAVNGGGALCSTDCLEKEFSMSGVYAAGSAAQINLNYTNWGTAAVQNAAVAGLIFMAVKVGN